MKRGVMSNVKVYRKHINIFWWANRWIHIKFIARELTSVCVAVYVMVLLFYSKAILEGEENWNQLTRILQSPFVIALHVLAFGGLIFHSITWFNLAPKAMVLKIGNNKVPGIFIALMNYGGWVFVSLILGWILWQV
jgi:fumarate reductase subunit C